MPLIPTLGADPNAVGNNPTPNPVVPQQTTPPVAKPPQQNPLAMQNIPGPMGGLNDTVRALMLQRQQNPQTTPQTNPLGSLFSGGQQGAPGPPMNINPPGQNMLTTPPPQDVSFNMGGLW